MTLQETVWIVEEESYASREAWAHSIGLSQTVHHELQTHRDHVYAHESQLHAHQTQLQLQGTLIQTRHQVYETHSQMQQAEMAELQETDHTREAGVDSLMHRSNPESEHSEQSSDDISMQDEGKDSDMEKTDNAHIPKVLTTTWFKIIPESERPDTPEPEWTIPPNDFPEPENNWANTYATTYKVPEENKLQRKTYDIGSFIKWFCRRTGKKKLCKADLEGLAFNLVKAFHKNTSLSTISDGLNAISC
ncbi:hypothetical protein Tco_1037351 [Tanacetum coccineum]